MSHMIGSTILFTRTVQNAYSILFCGWKFQVKFHSLEGTVIWFYVVIVLNHFLDISETLEPEVKILSLAIKSPGRPDIFLPVPESGNPKGMWFTLKEGSRYSLKFAFQVSNNIVSGLKYTNTVWKTGVKGTYLFLFLWHSVFFLLLGLRYKDQLN